MKVTLPRSIRNRFLILLVTAALSPNLFSQGSVVSKHVLLQIPPEREWLGRESIAHMEECFRFVNAVLDGKLPKRILLLVSWERSTNTLDIRESSITVGMASAAADSDMKSYLIHNAASEMARMALVRLSGGGVEREETRFIEEGMVEIVAREFQGNTRGLTGAWVLSQFLDRMQLLGFAAQSSWSRGSDGRSDALAFAPGVTFVMACRELYGQKETLKLIESLKKKNLEEALRATFRSEPFDVEAGWLDKVRSHQLPPKDTVISEKDAPTLRQTVLVPHTGRPGCNLQVRLFIQDEGQNLSPRSVFVADESSGRVLHGRASSEDGAQFTLVEIPIEEKRQPGEYKYRATAVDNAGNVREWLGSYTIE